MVYSERSKSLQFADHINKVSKKYGKNWNFKRQRHLLWEYKKHTKFVPGWFVYETALYFNMDLSIIEKKIIRYMTFRGKNEVYKPNLPIFVTPEFTAIAIHAMCDGSFIPSEQISYSQMDRNNFKRFIKILENVFGKYKFSDGKRKDNVSVTYTPKIFAKIISDYYNIKDFSTFKCRISTKIKSSTKLHKLSVLSSFLLDEGHTVAGTNLSSSNKRFLMDIIEIAKSLDYQCNSLVTYHPNENENNKLTRNHYRFSLSAYSLEKLYLDLKYLFEKFPSLHIDKKFENIENSIKIRNRGWIQRGKGETKQIILNLLEEGDKTAFDLRDLTNISIWTVYHHLQQLMKKKKITKYKKFKRKFVYKLL